MRTFIRRLDKKGLNLYYPLVLTNEITCADGLSASGTEF
jgi:hypothetical protein